MPHSEEDGTSSSPRNSSSEGGSDQEEEEGLTLAPDGRTIAFEGELEHAGFNSFPNALSLDTDTSSALLADCREVFCGETFFLPEGQPPRCLLEQVAAAVYAAHTGRVVREAGAASGAEWWVQLREGAAQHPVDFHWDKDEDLMDAQGLVVHPHISTVTYLTDGGAPTLILDGATTPLAQHDAPATEDGTGEDTATHLRCDPDVRVSRAFLSRPKAGKHICFDGALLHGAHAGLDPEAPAAATQPRITFLVNVWLNYRPIGPADFPTDALQLVSKPVKPPPSLRMLRAPPAAIGTAGAATVRQSYLFGPTRTEEELRLEWPLEALGALPEADAVVVSFPSGREAVVGAPEVTTGAPGRVAVTDAPAPPQAPDVHETGSPPGKRARVIGSCPSRRP